MPALSYRYYFWDPWPGAAPWVYGDVLHFDDVTLRAPGLDAPAVIAASLSSPTILDPALPQPAVLAPSMAAPEVR